jgi:hypothetical protein
MDQGPLVSEQIDAGARFLGAFHQSYPVQSAFWLKDSEEGAWYLYVASDQITDDNFDVAYGEVVRIAGELQDPWFDTFQLKVIGADDPLAKAAADLRRRYPSQSPVRIHNRTFGDTFAEEVYLYPSPLPAPAR